MPILFRILYCCAARIKETLCIKKQDLDLDSGVIKTFPTGCPIRPVWVLDLSFLAQV